MAATRGVRQGDGRSDLSRCLACEVPGLSGTHWGSCPTGGSVGAGVKGSRTGSESSETACLPAEHF